MKKVYLVDSENVGDVWVPLLAASLPEEEVVVFYTQQSPHMGYENVRLLKETEKIPVFIKCFEGRNALDFQLVTELGYRLRADEECEYVIISTDTGFDAAVRYWSSQKKRVRRINGKECFRQAMGRLRRNEAGGEEILPAEPVKEQDAAGVFETTEEMTEAAEKTVTEKEETNEVSTQENTLEESQNEQPVKTKSGARRRRRRETKKHKVEVAEAETAQEAAETEADPSRKTAEKDPETVTAEKDPETVTAEIDPEPQVIWPMDPETVIVEIDPELQLSQQEEPEAVSVPELTDAQQEAPEHVAATENALPELDDTERIVTNLFRCIQKDNLADFHNAMVMFLGEEDGKRLYLEAKNSPECNAFWAEQSGNSQKERFDIYCEMVFEHSEPAEKSPEDFADFLWKANGKRKNLNSLRAALQAQYGKDKGMKYYSLFKSHIKIMNRM